MSFITLTVLYFIDGFERIQIKAKVFAIVSDYAMLGERKCFGWIEDSVTDEILVILTIISGLIFAFSKEKYEDEMVKTVRLNSLALATIVNYILIVFSYMFIYAIPFLTAMSFIMFSQLLIFIILFRYNIYKLNKTGADEE